MKTIIIAAVAKNGAIGKNNRLLWKLTDDMKFFKETTMGHTVVTGRKNYESIPEKFRPLPGRKNMVVTRNPQYTAPGAIVVNSLEKAIESSRTSGEKLCYIIGGGEIYKEALEKKLVDEMLLTLIEKDFDADTFFPEFNVSDWKTHLISKHPAGNGNDASFTIVSYQHK